MHIADVEVDPETGKVTILRYTAIQDAGKAIHPSYVEGQMQGGAVQGIGWALNEEYFFDDQDQMRNASFLDYRMPTCLDVPMIETIIVEVPNPAHPFGVRGVGETPIVPPPAAIANAIHHAVGVRMRDLPMSPPALWKAMSSGRDLNRRTFADDAHRFHPTRAPRPDRRHGRGRRRWLHRRRGDRRPRQPFPGIKVRLCRGDSLAPGCKSRSTT